MPSRQREWQKKQHALGNCIRCGKPRGEYPQFCADCHRKRAEARRKKDGHKPWRPGGMGRPPVR